MYGPVKLVGDFFFFFFLVGGRRELNEGEGIQNPDRT